MDTVFKLANTSDSRQERHHFSIRMVLLPTLGVRNAFELSPYLLRMLEEYPKGRYR